MAQWKNPPASEGDMVQSLGQEDPLEKGTATHSSILAWRIPWTEKAGGLQSMGSLRVGHNWSDLAWKQHELFEGKNFFKKPDSCKLDLDSNKYNENLGGLNQKCLTIKIPRSYFFFNFTYLLAPGLSYSMWDLVPWPGIKSRPSTLGGQSLSHQTTRKVPLIIS